MSEPLIRLNGKPVHILFRNDSTFYTVMRFKINDKKEKVITVSGIFASIEKDTLYNIYGHYVNHPRYGMQFAAESYEKPLPDDRDSIIRFLSSAHFPGIGKKAAETVVDALGNDCITLLKEKPELLDVLPLTDKQIASFKEGIASMDDSMEQLVRFLNIHGIGMRNLAKLNRTYGKEALSVLKENPYCIIEDCDGIGFATADKIAMNLGFAQNDERRLYAYLVSQVMDLCVRDGDSYIELDALRMQFENKTKGLTASFDDLLYKAVMNRQLMQEDTRIYPITQFEAETEIAHFLHGFPYKFLEPCDKELLEQYLDQLEQASGITYDETQKDAIVSFFENPFLIVTGGPGTGKTTVVQAMVRLFQLLYPSSNIICAAPTGRAAKRLYEVTGAQSSTIHSLLQWDLESNRFGRNAENPLTEDLLIIDEFSMVDAWLFSRLALASHNIKKICIIGDEDQLPSVGPGSVLRDLIDSQQFPLIRLDHIYRQSSGSDVITLAHDIHDGHVNLDALKTNVAFFNCPDDMIATNAVTVVRDALNKNYTINDIQVLSPMYKGAAGIDTLNASLQEAFNPPDISKKEVRYGYTTFREGDKILQLKNQPDDAVFNGDIGILEAIEDAKERDDHKTTIIVNFQENYVEYNQDNWNNITLAYCISVHKAQGSEYPIVIMPFSRAHTIMLQKKLIYTAITRARRSLVLLGNKEAFERGVEAEERHIRATTLVKRLKDQDPFA